MVLLFGNLFIPSVARENCPTCNGAITTKHPLLDDTYTIGPTANNCWELMLPIIWKPCNHPGTPVILNSQSHSIINDPNNTYCWSCTKNCGYSQTHSWKLGGSMFIICSKCGAERDY